MLHSYREHRLSPVRHQLLLLHREVAEGLRVANRLEKENAMFHGLFGTWETRGFKIDGEYLSHLRFADDILICANTPHELQQMLQELPDENENQGLKMNKSKTKVMIETDTPTYRSRTLKATSTWDRDTETVTQTKTSRFKVESQPDGQNSPSTATSSRVTLEHV